MKLYPKQLIKMSSIQIQSRIHFSFKLTYLLGQRKGKCKYCSYFYDVLEKVGNKLLHLIITCTKNSKEQFRFVYLILTVNMSLANIQILGLFGLPLK